ncbi:asparagine--tRNA ligase [Mycoplasmoides pneumoniae]|uniref:Asparagine--tRNA ligase n=1 Tax=Mycoplasma pneumoniae (strain ATCC 29342 / M129 / Subtype 1) TaxID=272634 RepID=SYN_MYCPN|nr:asparagine--tRNA ligase [Mycoplasmoides pneumoniae]P75521.1 RecName: Full=Asparagine--tRNA ligase; AltName: Full=Asparaginyl-tRNA synthetase; Short=AsnRS [Mycoplasmoides pneumoniae M129]AAB96228.1 asparaginyl-tRNA synthetase [Mycoplasmoides pneumoniae M129]AGC04177.1 asparaginyl-tRNA synthetase [Mycoplasmoides pneumoniae M129-B7]ALA30135.1 asparaginyl-tRNA synthetase [Mycoplasmoides pneumoniae PI 1428]ALA32245.1 asparaginyl-tRNA synthetase [Mycoplasmoides pneumoniae 51494]ALA32946.1 aspara
MSATAISDLFEKPAQFKNKKIKLTGWLKNKRTSANIIFLEVNDGSTLLNLQAVVKQDQPELFALAESISLASAVSVSGTVALTPKSKQPLELVVKQINVLSTARADYPLQKKEHSLEFFRNNAYLRVRARTYFAIMKVRSLLSQAIFDYFFKNDFVLVHSPILTSNDCEGAGETFELKQGKEFFNKTTYLTVSGQFGAECYAQAFKKVFTFGPTFRAEKSHTSRHLSEFWMIEPEVAFANLKDLIKLIESTVKTVIKQVMQKAKQELDFLEKQFDVKLMERLKQITSTKNFHVLEYTKALEILKTAQASGQANFEVQDFNFGLDLKTEHERFLCEQHFHNQPVFVINYPKDFKAFYMKQNADGRTVGAVDLLFPQIGEICGGSEREGNLEKLVERCQAMQIDTQTLNWYLDMRKWGYFASAGFGLGFDRLLAYICGLENIRDAIPFPRAHGSINY